MTDRPRYDLFAACAPGFEDVAAKELFSLGIAQPCAVPGGVEFRGFLSHVYKVNLWSRTAERVLLRLGEFRAITFKELRDKARHIAWENVVRFERVALRVTCHKSRLIHSDAVAERIVAAIGDRLGRSIERADQDDAAPLIVARLVDDMCTISLDTSGTQLHLRGYRQAAAKAPLRETLAAAMLLASGWIPDRPLIDPFCGAGTIPIEAALIARHIAPGRQRCFAFMDWPNFDRAAWAELLIKADEMTSAKAPSIIQGSDRNAGAIAASRSNAERAGVLNDIEFTPRAVSAIEPIGRGWIVTNPPYGQRVSADYDLRNLYAQLGKVLRAKCAGWHVAMLAGNAQLEHSTGLKFEKALRIDNGGLKVRLVQGTVPDRGEQHEQ